MESVQVDKKSRPQEKMEIKSVTIHANPLAG
jgi:peptidyl-prolyl cis-trans isomerase-like 3